MKNTDFIIRAYGRQELACMCFPESGPRSAWRRLKAWIMFRSAKGRLQGKNPRMRESLAPAGRMTLLRSLTPREVRLIVDELGEP